MEIRKINAQLKARGGLTRYAAAKPYTITRIRFHRGLTSGGYEFLVGKEWYPASDSAIAKIWADIAGWELSKGDEFAKGKCLRCNITIEAPSSFTMFGLAIMMQAHTNRTRFDGKALPGCPVAQSEVDFRMPRPVLA